MRYKYGGCNADETGMRAARMMAHGTGTYSGPDQDAMTTLWRPSSDEIPFIQRMRETSRELVTSVPTEYCDAAFEPVMEG